MTADNNTISAIGLLFDFVGVILMFIYGLSPKLKDISERGRIVLDEPSEEDIMYNKRNKLGLILIGIGFTLQAIGNEFIYNFIKGFCS